MADDTKIDESTPATVLAESGRAEMETLPSYRMESVDIDYKAMLQKFQERALFVEGVRKEVLSKTKAHQWLGRRDKAGNATYNLMGFGAERIKTLCPIGIADIQKSEETWNKESGPGYTVYYSAQVYLGDKRTGTLPVMGSCSSDDDFFSTEHAKLPYNSENPEQQAALESGEGKLSRDKQTLYIRRRIQSSEISKENIVKSALTNLIVNSVTRVLGIRQISEEELKEVGIDIGKVPSVDYGSARKQSGRLSPAAEQKRNSLWDMLLEVHGEDAKAAAALKKFTAFNDYQGQDDPQKLSEKQVEIVFGKVKSAYDKHRGEPSSASKGKKDKHQREML